MGLGCNKHANCIKKIIIWEISHFYLFCPKKYMIFHEPLIVTENLSHYRSFFFDQASSSWLETKEAGELWRVWFRFLILTHLPYTTTVTHFSIFHYLKNTLWKNKSINIPCKPNVILVRDKSYNKRRHRQAVPPSCTNSNRGQKKTRKSTQ